jgi:hypothetical protein
LATNENHNYVTKSFTLEQDQMDKILDVKFKKRFDSNSDVVRKALEIGLKELDKDGTV